MIELLVTMAILAILLALAVPSMTSLINGNRLTAQANEMVAAFQKARTEAVRLNGSVRLCRSTNGTSCAGAVGAWDRWIIIGPANQILGDTSATRSVAISGSGHTTTFRADGLARDTTGALLAGDVFTVCMPTTRPAENRRVLRAVSGSRVAVEAVNGSGACP